MNDWIDALFTFVGGVVCGAIGMGIYAAESEESPEDLEESCKETSRLLADIEGVENGRLAIEFAHVQDGKCRIIVHPVDGESKVYTLGGAKVRIELLMKKHGAAQ